MEGDDGGGEAALLRQAVRALQAPHDPAPRLQVQAQAKEKLFCQWKEDEDCRFQSFDEATELNSNRIVHSGRITEKLLGLDAFDLFLLRNKY